MKNKINIFILFITLAYGYTLNAQEIIPDSIITDKQDMLMDIPYGQQPSWSVNSSISSIKGQDLKKSFTSNVANTLYGRLPGLTVQQGSGEPGNDSPSMNIRGINTFGSGSGIFYVIDGMPSTETFFQQLTPEEIESVSVLKDASATVIYGSRAANGVLLVTTKRGKESPLKVDFSLQHGYQQGVRLPDFLGSYDYARLYNEAQRNDGIAIPLYTDDDLNAYRNGSDRILYPDVDWYDELLRSMAPITNFNFTATGGSKTIRYFVLLNVVNNGSLYRNTEKISEFTKNASYTRYNFRTNLDITINDWLSAAITLGGTVRDKTNPGTGEYTNEIFDLMATIPSNAFPVYANNNKLGGNTLFKNPLGEISQAGYVSTNSRVAQTLAKLTADLSMVTPGLSISGTFGFNTYFKTYSTKSREYERFSVSKNPTTGELVYTQFGQNTSLSADEGRSEQWRNYVIQGFLNYKREFGSHDVDAMLIANYDDYTIPDGDLPYINLGLGGRFTYAYNKRYVGEFSFGYYGNDNFPSGHRFGFFPAGSLGWIISNEDFLKDNSIINYLKIRGSYGLTGNSDIGGRRYMYNQYYDYGGSYHLGTNNDGYDIYKESSLAYPQVTWEKEKKLNIGFEAILLKQFSVNFDFFSNKRNNILAKPYNLIPQYLGISLPDMNIGKTSNKGFEASIRYSNEEVRNLTFFAEASAWYARNKIDFNAEAPQLWDYLYSTGHRINQPFVLESIGFFADEADIANSPKQIFSDVVKPGDIKYKDQNGDNIIDQNDIIPLGYTSMPELTFGFHTGATYKGFDIDLHFQGALNRTVYQDGKYYQAFQNDGKISSVALDRWTKETASSAKYPRLSANNNMNNFQRSSFWQKNGNFLKLRSLELGYTLPKSLIDKIRINDIRVYLNGTNLFSIDHMNGFSDPETLSGYPSLRTFSLGVNVKL